MSYELRWLLLGLETVFRETVPVPASPQGKTTSLRVDKSLRTFVAAVYDVF